MTFSTYRDLFAAVAESAATLTGLLFVAVSVTSDRRRRSSHATVVQPVRAGAALVAFTNALTVSLFALVPRSNVGTPAVVMGIIGLFFTAAATRSIFAAAPVHHLIRQELSLIVLLLLAFGTEVISGIILIVNAHSTSALDAICDVLIVLLLIGVARAWELVGDRDTGIFASIVTLSGREPPRHVDPDLSPDAATDADSGGIDGSA